jgi:hypothetical protein
MEPLVIFSIGMMLALLGASALRYQARGDSQFAMRQSLLVAIFNALLLLSGGLIYKLIISA